MNYQIQMYLNTNPYLKRFLRENSFYYKQLIRHPESIKEIMELMQKEYKLSLPDKLDKIRSDISLINTFMDVIN